MDIDRLKLLSAEDRKAVLEADAIAIEEGKYDKPLTEDEVAFYKDRLAAFSINQAIILDEFKVVKDSYKEKLKPIAKEISESLRAIRTEQIERDGRLYKLADFDTQMMHKVDELGNVIHSRKMLPEERQLHLNAMRSLRIESSEKHNVS